MWYIKKIRTLICLIALCGLTSCVSVKEYQKMYLNDEDMKLAEKTIAEFESNFQTYREGTSGGNGGKSGGGCGCN